MDTTKTPAVHPLLEKTLTDAPLGYNNAEAGAWANGYNSAIEDHATLAAENAKLRAALEAMCEDMEHHNFGIKSPEQWQTASYLTAREVLASLTT